jgi:regulator of replication initiation timing
VYWLGRLFKNLFFKSTSVITGVIFLVSLPTLSANIQVANLKQDLELIAREVAGLRTEVEMLRRENAQLRISLQQVSKNASIRTGDSQGLLVQIDSRVRKLESRLAANEKNTASLQSSFDLKIQDLVNKMNQNFAKVAVSTPSSPPPPSFSSDYPQNGFVHKVEKEKRLAVLPKNISPKLNGLSMPTRFLTLRR